MTYHVLARFRDDPELVGLAAPFTSLVAMHHPHRANADPPARWVPKVHLAAALDALMLIPGAKEPEEAALVFGVARDVGLPLKGERKEKTGAATVVNLRKNLLAGHGDPGAIKTFGQLRFDWAGLFGDGQDADRWRSTVLADLRTRIAELVAAARVRARTT
jgi:hypothetical protein